MSMDDNGTYLNGRTSASQEGYEAWRLPHRLVTLAAMPHGAALRAPTNANFGRDHELPPAHVN